MMFCFDYDGSVAIGSEDGKQIMLNMHTQEIRFRTFVGNANNPTAELVVPYTFTPQSYPIDVTHNFTTNTTTLLLKNLHVATHTWTDPVNNGPHFGIAMDDESTQNRLQIHSLTITDET